MSQTDPETSERVSSLASYPVFQQRSFYFMMQLAQQPGTPEDTLRWTFNNSIGSYGAYMMIASDPSVTQGADAIDPWSLQAANDALTDGALFAAVNAQWAAIQIAAGLETQTP